MSVGQDMPKKPASKRAWCHPGCASQYSSDVDDAGSFGLFVASHSRSRARNAASAGESPKSIGTSRRELVVGEDAGQVGADAAQHVDAEERPAQVDVGQALP